MRPGDSVDMVHNAYSRSPVAPPTYRVALAERARLLALARAGGPRRVLLVDAPAGYGKTWLLARRYAELRADGTRVAWVGVEDPDPAQFLALVVGGLARAGIDVGQLEALAAHGFTELPLPAAVAALAQALERSLGDSAEVVLFVDDLHRLQRDAVRDVLLRMLAEFPAGVRFVCSGRDCGAIPRSTLRARGELIEIGTEDLRFRDEEARALLPSLAPADLARLMERTEGWPVALQLARLWLEAKPERAALIDRFSGRTSEVAEFLAEQVLGDLPADVLDVLACVSVVDSLNAELVGSLTGGPDAWSRLLDERRLEHFLLPLDEERYWFRLHHLLRDFLRARLRERSADLRVLDARASAWYGQHGFLREAVRHAVAADDVERAVRLVEQAGGWELVLFGGAGLMRALLGYLPPQRLPDFPRAHLFQAFLCVKHGEVARGLRHFEIAAANARASAEPRVQRDLLVVEHLIGRYADDPVVPGDLERLHARIDALPSNDDAARAALINTACLVALAIGDLPVAQQAALRATREMRRIGSVLGLNYCLFHYGIARLHLGERREAEAIFRDAAAMAEENFGADSGLKAIADVYLAVALHARGEIADAAERLAASLEGVEASDGWLDLYAEGYEVAIANALARGDRASARATCVRAEATASRRGLARLERLAAVFRARLELATAGEAREVVLPPWSAGAWREAPSAWRQHHAAGVVRVLAVLQDEGRSQSVPDLDAADAILLDLEAAALHGGRRRQLRVVRVLGAASSYARGARAAAVEALLLELDAAVSEDDTQFLVDLGPALSSILQQAWHWSRANGASSRVRQVLAQASTTLARPVTRDGTPALSAREFEVLVELARGVPNKIIARNLQMTENTVKYHLKNVFQKLQVRHRAEAIHAARARGLLS